LRVLPGGTSVMVCSINETARSGERAGMFQSE